MSTRTLTGARSWGPRLLILSALATLVIALIGAPGGASAAAGPTDLSVTKSDSADPVVKGNNFTYTIQVTNLGMGGTADATNVTVVDTLPSHVDFVSATASAGTCQQAAGIVTCNLGQVDAEVTASVTIAVKAQKPGTASNLVTVASVDDTNATNNQDTETTTIVNKGQAQAKKRQQASCASPTISGTPGNDTLVGTSGADVIRAFAGDDQVFAGGGRDLICADLGADLVSGGPKGDTVIGGGGPDRLIGNTGGDVLRGKSGRDRLRGNFGNDLLNGGRGIDSCKGGPGQDSLRRCP